VRTPFTDIPGILARGAQSGPHSPLCGSESGDAPSAQGTVRIPFTDIPGILARGDQSGPHSPLCGSESGDAPSAQGTVRTPFADSSSHPEQLQNLLTLSPKERRCVRAARHPISISGCLLGSENYLVKSGVANVEPDRNQ
jgi:hypothetical protein